MFCLNFTYWSNFYYLSNFVVHSMIMKMNGKNQIYMKYFWINFEITKNFHNFILIIWLILIINEINIRQKMLPIQYFFFFSNLLVFSPLKYLKFKEQSFILKLRFWLSLLSNVDGISLYWKACTELFRPWSSSICVFEKNA